MDASYNEVIRSTEQTAKKGVRSLATWRGVMDVLTVGSVRDGAGVSIEDIAETGLIHVSVPLLGQNSYLHEFNLIARPIQNVAMRLYSLFDF